MEGGISSFIHLLAGCERRPVMLRLYLPPRRSTRKPTSAPPGIGSCLYVCMESLEFYDGRAEISEVTRCSGDAFLVTVRSKKRVGYTYELTLKVKGEWHIGGEKKKMKGHIDVPEFSFGELDDLQIEVKLSEDKDVQPQDKQGRIWDLKLFLQPLRERLLV